MVESFWNGDDCLCERKHLHVFNNIGDYDVIRSRDSVIIDGDVLFLQQVAGSSRGGIRTQDLALHSTLMRQSQKIL